MGKHDGSYSDAILLKEIYKKLTCIEAEVERLKSRPEYHINVEKLDVQQLENLIFRLDNLDIKELSGTLNIGNNFDAKKPPRKEAEKSSSKNKSKRACKKEVES